MPTRALPHHAAQPGQEFIAVLEEEKREHQHYEHGDHDRAGNAEAGKYFRCDRARFGLQPLGSGVDAVVQVTGVEVHGWPLKPELQALHPFESLEIEGL